jgi:hypothetical protein
MVSGELGLASPPTSCGTFFPLRQGGRSVQRAQSWSPGISRSGDRAKAGLERVALNTHH